MRFGQKRLIKTPNKCIYKMWHLKKNTVRKERVKKNATLTLGPYLLKAIHLVRKNVYI